MKKLFTTLGIIFTVAGSSLVLAASDPQLWWNVSSVHIIPNEACIQYTADWIVQKACDTVNITYHDTSYACLSITSSGSVVELDDDGKWSMKFRCDAVSSGSHSFHIDCGNWLETYDTWTTNWFATYTCHYTSGDAWKYFTWSCLVDDDSSVNPSCEKTISIDYPVPNCWDGIIKPGEYCDLKLGYNESGIIYDYLDYYGTVTAWQFANHWYTCLNCMIMTGSNYVYEPAECLYTDTPISVMNNEIMPFWWRLWIEDAEITDNDDECRNWTNTETTLLWKPSMKCHFAVYNWNHKQWDSSIQKYVTDCYNSNFTGKIFDYFKENHQTSADWASVATVNAVTSGLSNNEYWEYKLVLEKVEYEYCAGGGTHKGERYWAVCEVNFAVTRPYVMQISTFGVNPIGATNKDFLYDFYDMEWNQLLDRTDLKWTMNISSWTYASEKNIQDEIQKFQDKYEKLAVKVNNDFRIKGSTTISDIFWDNEVKKVPNQHIYFVKWSSDLRLEQNKINQISSAYTIFADWMNVKIEGNVLQYAMIITNKKIIFKDRWEEGSSSCASWWQVVQWLFIAWDWFKGDNQSLWNRHPDEKWCPRWWLRVKWALIWSWVVNLTNWKRSQLNSWFNSNILRDPAIKNKRKQLIIGWAAVLIEYSPSLWKTLPPGAEIFTESLEVYRK